MSDVIQRLLDVEKEARRIIARAEAEAASTASRAGEQARKVSVEAREKARGEADDLYRLNALAARREARLAQAKAELPTPDSLDPDGLAKAAHFIVAVVSGLESAQP